MEEACPHWRGGILATLIRNDIVNRDDGDEYSIRRTAETAGHRLKAHWHRRPKKTTPEPYREAHSPELNGSCSAACSGAL